MNCSGRLLRTALMFLVLFPGAAHAVGAATKGQPAAPPAAGGAARPDRPADDGPLSAEQVARVRAILADYKPATLTADQARAIHEAFRTAGIRGGQALNEAVRAAGFDPDRLRDLAPPPGQAAKQGAGDKGGGRGSGVDGNRAGGGKGGAGGGKGGDAGGKGGDAAGSYSIEQAVSDRAQLNTIAFDGLAFLTGGFGCNTFLPPGKVADFCGFQYMRDVDRSGLGHNTSFVPRIANAVLAILDAGQRAQLVALAAEQEPRLAAFAQARYPLVAAYCRNLEGDLPAGTTGLDRDAVVACTGDVFLIDGELSWRRAEVLGGIIRSLTADQRRQLAAMRFDDSSTWPDKPDQVDKRSLSHARHVAVMTYASELFSWYAGTVESDTYFCPERHATYFGSFYMKDIPAMGNPGYAISTALTGDSGEAFLATLTEPQRRLVTGLVDGQRQDLASIVQTRRAIATELRRLQAGPTADRQQVMSLARRYGELDGAISYRYALAFREVARTLTAEQHRQLLKLRNLDARFDCTGAYMFSDAVPLPAIPDVRRLFTAAPAGTRR